MFNLLRNKAVVLLIVLIMVGLVLGSLHTESLRTGKPFLIQDGVRTVLSPLNRVLHVTLAVGNSAVHMFRPRYMILRENRELRKDAVRLSRENVKLRAAAHENVELRAALNLRETSNYDLIAAEVISRDPNSWFDVATTDKGRHSGVAKGSAVVTPRNQLVGQVLSVDINTSQIVALTDPSSAVGAMVERSRSTGLLQGEGADYLLFSYLPKDANIQKNDIVVSSGMGKIIPKGLPIGRVVQVMRNTTAGTTSAWVRPSVQFDRIEQILIMKTGQVAE